MDDADNAEIIFKKHGSLNESIFSYCALIARQGKGKEDRFSYI